MLDANHHPTTGGLPERQDEIPDLQTQFEAILNTVWHAEANWRLDDRLDLALKHQNRAR